jgi:cobalamin biosynthesis Mg chelatase CobN
MPKETTINTNMLPHNPLKAAALFEAFKKLRGEMKWLEFDLRCGIAYADANKVTGKHVDELRHGLQTLTENKAKAEAEANKKAAEAAAATSAPETPAATSEKGASKKDSSEPAPAPAPDAKAAAGTTKKTPGSNKAVRKTAAEVTAANNKKKAAEAAAKDAEDGPAGDPAEIASELAEIK